MKDTVRPYTESDEEAVVALWHRAGRAAYPYLPLWQAMSLDLARQIFREHVRPHCELWVGERDGRIVAYLAMNGSLIDRLYVEPSEWRTGWGTRLVAFAKERSPEGLQLYTHQENGMARRLYEKLGFRAVAFGISPPPESAPDVEYHWHPST